MKKKILALAIASSLAVPQVALAAEDTAGMHYTSASEGFYASIRAQLNFTGNAKNGAANLNGGSSRFGVAGTNDIGGGLEGFYTYEAGINIANGGSLSTRLGNVGLRGGFGEFRAGTFWDNSYNWTHGSGTDIANVYSGYFTYSDNLPARVSNSIQYTSPDLNGFQVAVRGSFDRSRDGAGAIGTTTSLRYRTGVTAGTIANLDAGTVLTGTALTSALLTGATANIAYGAAGSTTNASFVDLDGDGVLDANEVVLEGVSTSNLVDDNDLDSWAISAKYDVQGFSLGATYLGRPDVLEKTGGGRDDWNAYVLKGGYSQDNWYVNAWYSKDNASDGTATNDEKIFALGGGVTINKIALYGIYEDRENASAQDDKHYTLGVQYNLGAKSRAYVEYFGQDYASSTTEDNDVVVGVRHDF